MLLTFAGIALLTAHFALWRAAPRWAGAIFALPWTVWGAEVLLAALASPPAPPPPVWAVEALPPVASHHVPVDLGAAPDDRPTVVVIGDSFAAGQGVREAETFARQLGQGLAGRGDDARVLLQAMPGWNLGEELVAYSALAAPTSPDVVVWTLVLNDLGLPGRAGVSDLITGHAAPSSGLRTLDLLRDGLRHREVEATTTDLYRRAFAPDRAQVVAFEAALARLAGEVTGRGGRFVLVVFPLLHRLDAYPFADVHARLRALGEAAGAEVVDLLDVFAGRDAAALWVSPSDHHPNAAGHALAAEALLAHLDRIPQAGPTRCADLPVLPALEGILQAACASPDPHTTVALAEALVTHPPVPPLTFDGARMGANLAVVALHRAAALPEAERRAVHERAVAVVQAWRASRRR